MSRITWTNERVKLSALQPWDLNPRQSTRKQAERILASFEQFGQVLPFSIGPDNEVYDGHQRLSALLTVHGNGYEVDARRSNVPLSDQERRELVVTLHAGAVGSWDWDALSGWQAPDLLAWGFDGDTLADWKRDVGALTNLIESEKPEPADAEPQVDRAEELRVKWGTERGQLWRIGAHRLLCGDSTVVEDVERVMGGERAGAVVTDPPYAIFGSSTGVSSAVADDNMVRPFFREIGKAIAANVEPFGHAYVFCDWRSWAAISMELSSSGLVAKNCLVWDKGDFGLGNMYRSCHEFIGFFTNDPYQSSHYSKKSGAKQILKPNVFRVNRTGQGGFEAENEPGQRFHNAAKPVNLIAELCENSTEEGEIVMDPFLGAGTTLVACQNLGRRGRGIEISPAYCAVILERMATAFPGIEIEKITTNTTQSP